MVSKGSHSNMPLGEGKGRAFPTEKLIEVKQRKEYKHMILMQPEANKKERAWGKQAGTEKETSHWTHNIFL